MLPRYLSIFAHFTNFRLGPFAIFPYWVFFIRWSLQLREWLFLFAIVFASFWVSGVLYFLTEQLLLFSNVIELLLFCLFVLLGQTLFAKATKEQLLKVGLGVAVLTILDYYVFNLAITHTLSHGGVVGSANKSDRGAYILSTEPSYWGLTLLGFYAYCLVRRWWLPTMVFVFLLLLNHSIYTMAFFFLMSVFLLPRRLFLPITLLFFGVLLLTFVLGIFPTRLLEFIENILSGKYDLSNLLSFVLSVEGDYGSRRFSNVIKSVIDANLWSPQFSVQPYSFMTQLISVYGWVLGLIFMVWLYVLLLMRYKLHNRDAILLLILLILAGPVSIPFMFSYLFGLYKSEEAPPDEDSDETPTAGTAAQDAL